MNETVTVEQAIKKGIRLINYPVWTIFIIAMLSPIYFTIKEIIPVWAFFICFILAIFLPILYWAFMVTKWKLWAFENVRNVHELKKRAIQERIIREDNSFYEKLEIRNFEEKEKWKTLQKKFNISDIFKDDLTIPDETKIYFSKRKNYTEFIIFSFCLLIPIMIFLNKGYISGTIFLIVIIFLIYKSLKNIINNSPQIIINNKGIQTISSNFHKWDEIINDEAIKIGKYSHLIYNHPNGEVELNIEDYNITQRELNKLLILYRGRSQKNN